MLFLTAVVSPKQMEGMYGVFGLRLGPNFVVRLAADKNFCLQLTVEKMQAFAVFNDRNLWPYGCSDTYFYVYG